MSFRRPLDLVIGFTLVAALGLWIGWRADLNTEVKGCRDGGGKWESSMQACDAPSLRPARG